MSQVFGSILLLNQMISRWEFLQICVYCYNLLTHENLWVFIDFISAVFDNDSNILFKGSIVNIKIYIGNPDKQILVYDLYFCTTVNWPTNFRRYIILIEWHCTATQIPVHIVEILTCRIYIHWSKRN